MAARRAQPPTSRSRKRQHGHSKQSSSLSTGSEQQNSGQHRYSFRCAAAAATGRIQKVGRNVARRFEKGRQMAASIPLGHLDYYRRVSNSYHNNKNSRIRIGVPHLSSNILLSNFFTLTAWAASPSSPIYLPSSTICPYTGELMYGADTIQDASLRDLVHAAAGSTAAAANRYSSDSSSSSSSFGPLRDMNPRQRLAYESTGRCMRAFFEQRGGVGRLLASLRAQGVDVAADGDALDKIVVRGGHFADWMSKSLVVGWQGQGWTNVGRDGGPDELLLKQVREAVGSWFAGEGQEVVSQEVIGIEVTELMVTCVAVVGLVVLGKVLWDGRRRWW